MNGTPLTLVLIQTVAFAGVILFGVIGYVSSQLLAIAEHRLLRWRRPY